jgi:hypothetical protein
MPSAKEKRHLRIAQERVDQEEAVAAERRRRQKEKVRQAGTKTRTFLRKLVDWRTGAVITILLVGYVRLQIHERSVFCAVRNAWHSNYEAQRPLRSSPWWRYETEVDWQKYPTLCSLETGEPLPWP